MEPDLPSGDEIQYELRDNEDPIREEVAHDRHEGVQYIKEPISDEEWEAAVLLSLKENYFCPFNALEFVSSSMREYNQRKRNQLKVF